MSASTERSSRGVVVAGVLEPGQRLGDTVIPAGQCGIGFHTPDQTFVYVESREGLLEFLDDCRRELLNRAGWGEVTR